MDKPVVSSSPLKTATSASTAPSKNVAAAMGAYISKYCEIATGNRVVFQGYHAFAATTGWFRFKCKTCQDNWNMKEDLFQGMNSCPKELQDWLDQHKHVCNKFASAYGGANPKCFGCGWGWNQHKIAQPVFDIATGTWSAINPPEPTPLPPGQQGPVGQQGPQGPTIAAVHYDKGHVAAVKAGTPFMGLPGQVVMLHKGEVLIPLYQGRSTGVRPCAVCEEPIPVATGVGLCDPCIRAAKKVHETKALTVTQTQGRMFRHKEGQCESQTLPATTPSDSAN